MSFSAPDNGSTSFPVNIVRRLRTWYDKQPYPLSKRPPMSYGWHQTTYTSTSTLRLIMPSMKLSIPLGSTWNTRWQTFSLHCIIAASQSGNEHILQKASGEGWMTHEV